MTAQRMLLAACCVAGVALMSTEWAAATPATGSGTRCVLSWAPECQGASDPTTTTTNPSTPPSAPGAPAVPPSPSDNPLSTTQTTPVPAPSGADTPEEDRPGFFDVVGRIKKAINDWFASFVNAAVQPVFDLFGDTVLSTPEFTSDPRLHGLWLVSWAVANTVFVLLILAAGVLGMAYETLQTRYRVKELLPRLAAAWITANASLVFARVLIGFANAVSRAFVAEGIGFEGVASVLKLAVSAAMIGSPALFTVLVALVAVVLTVCLVCMAIMRVCTVLVLIAAAPLFLIGYALPQTEGMAQLWWRSLFACLGIQVGQAVIVTTAVRVFFAAPEGNLLALPHSALMDLLVVVCLLWLALRIPSYATRLVFQSRRNAMSAVRYHVVGRGMRAATKAAGKAAKAAVAAAA